MRSKKKLLKHFLLLGMDIAGHHDTISKCLELCDSYSMDEETLVETWMAFCMSYERDIIPNVESLCEMERVDLNKDGVSNPNSSPPETEEMNLTKDSDPAGVSSPSSLSTANICDTEKPDSQKDSIPADVTSPKSSSTFAKVNKDLPEIKIHNLSTIKQADDDDDILEVYSASKPITPKTKRLRSPDSEMEINETKVRAVDNPFTPPTYSAKIEMPSRLSSKPSERGRILSTYGKNTGNWTNGDNDRVVKISKSENHEHVPSNLLYMYEKSASKAEAFDYICEEIGSEMSDIVNRLEDVKVDQAGSFAKSQYQFQTYGRICSDSDGKLDAAAIAIEGSNRLSAGAKMRIDLSKLNMFTVFPGQIVSLKGINPSRKLLVVENLFFEAPAPRPPLPLAKIIPEKNLQVVVAAGPYTASDNLKYEPLLDLINYVEENKPHVFIMIGPFVEFNHQEIMKCNISSTFDEFFERFVANIMQRLENSPTQVVLVPSNRDVHHEPIYPTPEFSIKQRYNNLHLMPDPCMIDIDGLIIGATSVDSIMDLGREEISFNAQGFNRLTRLATHILAQKCFYPLAPPLMELNVDACLWKKHCFMNQRPHILILPSTLRYFCNDIYECVTLNPERLSKGSFARLQIRYPMKNCSWIPNDNVSVEILKI